MKIAITKFYSILFKDNMYRRDYECVSWEKCIGDSYEPVIMEKEEIELEEEFQRKVVDLDEK